MQIALWISDLIFIKSIFTLSKTLYPKGKQLKDSWMFLVCTNLYEPHPYERERC